MDRGKLLRIVSPKSKMLTLEYALGSIVLIFDDDLKLDYLS